MGFMDKVKAQAQTAMQSAQNVAQQGQTKLDEMTARKQADALLRDLGAAIYAEQRTGGSAEATSAAWHRLDAHVATNGPISTTATAPPPAPQPQQQQPQQSQQSPGAWSPVTETPSATTFGDAPAPNASAPPMSPPATGPTVGRPTSGDFSLDDL